jgi:hypothetical protein
MKDTSIETSPLAVGRSCPIPSAKSCAKAARRRRFLLLALPLASFVIPTVVVGYGVVIPRSCIAGVNALSIGFGTTVLGACLAYFAGLRAALRS